ncbi:CLUMA_CG002644, isoform A [Clunio marinus]|uniref:CLUMA_CG002644, isoform A n=1 Tax=Clunio marinus TaxID=568069 RepID=A0A1J1HLX0_9DIPT|nr:CLUMA_CG002644, isoform A [Clunio marinus]
MKLFSYIFVSVLVISLMKPNGKNEVEAEPLVGLIGGLPIVGSLLKGRQLQSGGQSKNEALTWNNLSDFAKSIKEKNNVAQENN